MFVNRLLYMLPADEASNAMISEIYESLRKQIPIMYALMSANIIFLSVSTYGSVSALLSLGMPIAMAAAISVRAVLWVKRQLSNPEPKVIRQYLRGTMLSAVILGAVFGLWGVLLFEEAPAQRSSVAIYIFVGAISCCYCLLSLPWAARIILLFGAMPVTVQMLFSGEWRLFGISLNFLIVAIVILRTMAINNARFSEVIRSRSNMQAERERAQDAEFRAQQLAYSDPLTGLRNRRALNEDLDKLTAYSGPASQLGLMIIDLDRFKEVNDVHGHQAGDHLLQAVAGRLTDIVGDGAITYRLAGDEFAVTVEFSSSDPNPTAELAERIVTILAEPFHLDGLSHHIGASIGLSVSPREALDREALLRQADIALYKSKDLGRSQFHAFQIQMDVEITRRATLKRDLRADINTSAFMPFYQPIVDVVSGEISGFEMLARWKRADGEQIGPDQFIPVAEECGLVGDLMLQLLHQACIDAASWNPHVALSVNVSPVQLKDPWFSEKIIAVLARTRFPFPRLILEITENALISAPENASRSIASLKNQGILIALDDFGTGFSSIQHLRMLPFDKIKIDRSFLQNLERDGDSYKLVSAITQLAKTLDLVIVAEGIETKKSLEIVRELGCNEAQGYLLGRPMEARAAKLALQRGIMAAAR